MPVRKGRAASPCFSRLYERSSDLQYLRAARVDAAHVAAPRRASPMRKRKSRLAVPQEPLAALGDGPGSIQSCRTPQFFCSTVITRHPCGVASVITVVVDCRRQPQEYSLFLFLLCTGLHIRRLSFSIFVHGLTATELFSMDIARFPDEEHIISLLSETCRHDENDLRS